MNNTRVPFFRFSSAALNVISLILNISKEAQLNYFKGLRIYKNKSLLGLMNHLAINKALKYDLVVDNSHKIYKSLNTVFGNTIANKMVENTIGKVFTAGKDLTELESYLSREKDLSFIIDYCCEAIEGRENDKEFLDSNAIVMKNTIESCGKMKDKQGMIIAIKVSGLCEKDLLIKMNEGKERIINFFTPKIDITKQMTLEQLFDQLESKEGLKLNDNDKKEFCNILQLKPGESNIDFTRWFYKVHSYYLYETQNNKNKIIQHFSKLDSKDLAGLENVVKRFTSFLDPMISTSLRAVVDAEQTYFQMAIDSISEQMEAHYNHGSIKVMNTLQCYLKSSAWRMDYELKKAEAFNLPIGMKFVRGAYMVEESQISKEKNFECPICNSYDDTNQNYHRNVENYFKAQRKNSAVVIASHNVESSEHVKQLMKEYKIEKNSDAVTFAQLYGLADQLTYKLRDEVYNIKQFIKQGYRAAKYVPFGKTDIMIPYLIRRAQESKQMFESAKLQTVLLKDEFKKRILK